jgi:hypothetical protein
MIITENKRNEYTAVLYNNICVVTFTKRDGSERVMRCTLKPEHFPVLPVVESTTLKTPRKKSDTTICVWDLDKSAWRSFTVDSVKSIKQES